MTKLVKRMDSGLAVELATARDSFRVMELLCILIMLVVV